MHTQSHIFIIGNVSFIHRGKRVLDALLNNLSMDNGLQNASEVILTGCSGI